MTDVVTPKTVKLKMTIMYPRDVAKADSESEVEVSLDNYNRPNFALLRPLIKAALEPAADYERVRVFWDGKYLDMFVDEIGALKGLTVNERATEVYHNNARVHQPALLADAQSIHGPAVMFDKPVWF